MSHILVIDDDQKVRQLIELAANDSDWQLTVKESAEQAWPLLSEKNIDVCLLDIRLPEMNGLELAKKIRHLDARLPVVFISSVDDSTTAIEAMKLGAYEFCVKPLGREQIEDLIEQALETRRLMNSPVGLQSKEASTESQDELIGNSPEMLEVYKQIGRVAAEKVPVLIRGESGTGKELVARAIYQHSDRSDQCYLAVNCAALSESLLESELFGHEKGAFTGADRKRIGKFEQCDGGTIFLDEIGDMSPMVQGKVLRLLQERQFERLGGTEIIETDVRVISATNRDIEQMIEENDFRLDLYHRVNAIEIHPPPLRDRGDDINLLIHHFIRRLTRKLNKQIDGVSQQALQLLRQYSWPGNVRELESVIRRAILMAAGPVILPENLPEELTHNEQADPGSDSRSPNSKPDSSNLSLSEEVEKAITDFVHSQIQNQSDELYADTLRLMEKSLITEVLSETEGNQSKAAEILGITRGSLRNKIRSLGIVIEQSVSTE